MMVREGDEFECQLRIDGAAEIIPDRADGYL